MIQSGIGRQLAGGWVNGEGGRVVAAQAVGERVFVGVRGGDGLADVGARRRILSNDPGGLRDRTTVSVLENGWPVHRTATSAT